MVMRGTNQRDILQGRRRVIPMLILIALVAVSLILTSTANRLAGRLLDAATPEISWIATAAIPSFALIAILYLLGGDRQALRWPMLNVVEGRRAVRLSATWLLIWLSGMVAASFAAGHWITYAQGVPPVLAFLLFGPAGEELLFRGLIFQQARTVWPASAAAPIAISTIAFSLHHIQLHSQPLHGLAAAQLLFTIPMGVVFARLRMTTGSLWPAFLLHVATNLPAAL